MSKLIQFFTAEGTDLIASAERLFEEGEIDATERDSRLEYLAELMVEARELGQ